MSVFVVSLVFCIVFAICFSLVLNWGCAFRLFSIRIIPSASSHGDHQHRHIITISIVTSSPSASSHHHHQHRHIITITPSASSVLTIPIVTFDHRKHHLNHQFGPSPSSLLTIPIVTFDHQHHHHHSISIVTIRASASVDTGWSCQYSLQNYWLILPVFIVLLFAKNCRLILPVLISLLFDLSATHFWPSPSSLLTISIITIIASASSPSEHQLYFVFLLSLFCSTVTVFLLFLIFVESAVFLLFGFVVVSRCLLNSIVDLCLSLVVSVSCDFVVVFM